MLVNSPNLQYASKVHKLHRNDKSVQTFSAGVKLATKHKNIEKSVNLLRQLLIGTLRDHMQKDLGKI